MIKRIVEAEMEKVMTLVAVKAAFKQKQKVGLTGQEMLPMKNDELSSIVTNLEIYHQKYRKL